MGKRWRYSRSEDDDEKVVILSSSDDEEANEDLTLDIIEKSKKRTEKRSRSEDELTVNRISADVDRIAEELAEIETKQQKKKSRKKVEEIADLKMNCPIEEEELLMTTDSAPTKVNEEFDNVVLRKLLRVARYFDTGNGILDTCYNCGEEGHKSFNCTMEKRQKPCFICGMFGHNSRQCTQGQDCYICKRRGHLAKDCSDKHKHIPQDSKICLRCGDIGHDMSKCINNYAPDDLKEIQCYICKKYGHLCCAEITFQCKKEVSCYTCAQFGHTGLGCAKQCSKTDFVASPTLCYKCGEEGHFARGCNRSSEIRWRKGELSTPTRFPRKNRDPLGSKSVPRDFGKSYKKKNMQHEERWNSSFGKSRAKGGWLVDDPGDLPYVRSRRNGESSTPPKFPRKNRDPLGTKSLPRDFGKARKTFMKHEEWGNSSAGKHWTKGGWLVDDPGDLPNIRGRRNSEISPKTPSRKSYTSSHSPSKKHSTFTGTPNRHVPFGARNYGSSGSRSGNFNNRSWRN